MKSGYVSAQIDGDKLLLFCDDDITAGLLKAEPTKTRVQTAASELEGSQLRLRIYEPNQKQVKQEDNKSVDEILQKAQDLNIEITEL